MTNLEKKAIALKRQWRQTQQTNEIRARKARLEIGNDPTREQLIKLGLIVPKGGAS